MRSKTWLGAAVLTLATAVVGGAIAWAAPQRAITIAGTDNTFDKTEIRVEPGEAMDVTFVGAGFTSPHSIVFDLGAGNTARVEPASLGVTRRLTFNAPVEPGLYEYYCDVGNHRQQGMVGTLVVGDPGQAARTVTVEGSNYKYVPSEIEATPGEALDVAFKNVQGFHDIVFDLDAGRQAKTDRIQAGQTANVAFAAPATPGRYPFYCTVGMHRANGMEGVLIVTAPPEPRLLTFTGTNFAFDPSTVTVAPSEPLSVTFKNAMGTHDIVFELDGGRVERTPIIRTGEQAAIAFAAPAVPGTYAYYCSVGMHRANGMEGTLVVGGAEPTVPPPTAEPTVSPTAGPPSPVTPLIRDLKNPHGLWLQSVSFQGVEQDVLVVSEGGTGTPKPGEFTPGNGDGRVQVLGLDNPAVAFTVLDNMTNSLDPGGGVVGANHAIPWPLDAGAAPTSLNLLVAQSGGPGQLRPAEAAKILKVGLLGTPTVLADTLAYETANNPDGADPNDGGIDSNPWHLVPGPRGDAVFVVDAGANDILKLDPVTGALSTWAVLEPYEDGAQQAIPTGLAFSPVDPDTAYVSLLGGFQAPTGRIVRLTDVNKDGDVLDENEFHEHVTGLDRPTALAFSPGGRLYVAELGTRRISYVPEVASGVAGVAFVPVVTGVSGLTALAFEPDGDLLVSYDIDGAPTGRASQSPDTVGRIAAAALEPTGVPTAAPTAPSPTPPPPTATAPAGGRIFLPVSVRTAELGS